MEWLLCSSGGSFRNECLWNHTIVERYEDTAVRPRQGFHLHVVTRCSRWGACQEAHVGTNTAMRRESPCGLSWAVCTDLTEDVWDWFDCPHRSMVSDFPRSINVFISGDSTVIRYLPLGYAWIPGWVGGWVRNWKGEEYIDPSSGIPTCECRMKRREV